MGRFFSTIQIKNNGSREQFINSFYNIMKKRDLEACSEDEASVSYTIAFSESGKWVTLTSEVYMDSPKQAKDDANQTAAEMKTSSFSIDVIDSDWANIELYTGTDIHDTVIVGRSEFPDDPPKGRRECWEPLLVSGKTWEQLSEIWNKNEVFVEDALCGAASMLGIEPKYMVSDYEDFNDTADKDTNVVSLFFKKKITAINSGEKKLTMNAAFKQVFGEALEPLGFVKVKTKHPYYVRAVTDEIINVVTIKEEWSGYPNEKRFNIYSGIATVYRYKIDFDLSMADNKDWLLTIARSYYYTYKNSKEYDEDFKRSIFEFSYIKNNTESLLDAMQYVLELTEEFIIPIFDKARSLKDCAEFFSKYNLRMSTNNFKRDISFDDSEILYDEGLLYVKTNDEMLQSNLRKRLEKERDENSEKYQRTLEKLSFFDEPYTHEKVLRELERRKEYNTSLLRKYGVCI